MTPTATIASMETERGTVRVVRLALGALLLVLVLVPVYRLLDPLNTGLAGRATVGLADIFYDFAWTGLLLVLPVAIVAALLVAPADLARWTARASAVVLAPPAAAWFGVSALIGAVLTAAFSLIVLEGKPNLVDAFAQLLQARYWAEGMLAGPADGTEFWGMQNALVTERGWVSQYPPGHIALLVPFLRLGTPWLLGPVLVAITIASAGPLTRRLLPDDPIVARLGTALLAVSPFFLFLSGAYMNHATTAAFVTLGAWALVRSWQENAGWAVLAGAAFGLSLATRPLSTLAMGLALAALVPVLWPRPTGHLVKRAGLGLLGALPPIALWLAYNDYLFGSPFRLGYSVAQGPAMSLGFHDDPWGNAYGAREALAYTSSDLVTLGTHLFESPVSCVFVVGVFLLVARRLPRGTWLLLAMALAPVISNALYWHHGIFMGPRMLHEAAPMWVLLFTVAAVGLVRRVPATAALAGRYHLRPAVASALAASLAVGLLYMAPLRARSYGGEWMAIARTPLPEVEGPALIFVHDAWYARIATTLAAEGMRLDLVETLLRQNSTCRVHDLAMALAAGADARARTLLAGLDTVPNARRAIPEQDGVRVRAGETLSSSCLRQLASDRLGITDISPLLWQADLHGDADARGTLIARDLGPERNADLIAAHRGRVPWLYVAGGTGTDDGVILEYDEGARQLWSGSYAPR